MVTTEAADVVVVGGGPAGSTVACLLARAGHDVVQLERQHHPRHQIGESLLPATIHGVCRLLGVWDEVQEAGFVRKRGGIFRMNAPPDGAVVAGGEAPLREDGLVASADGLRWVLPAAVAAAGA